jgi:hypothetical protein
VKLPAAADFRARCLLTIRTQPGANTGAMDEPTHANESQFWDQVAEWLLGVRAMDVRDWSAEEIEALLRYMQERQEPH